MKLRRLDLGSGWSVRIPDDCEVERLPDGWSAWDNSHIINAQVVDGPPDPSPAEPLVADAPGESIDLTGATGRVREETEELHPEPVDWTHLYAVGPNTSIRVSVGNASPRDTGWHRMIIGSVEHLPSS